MPATDGLWQNSTLVGGSVNPPWFRDLLQLPIVVAAVLAFSCIAVGVAWCYWRRKRLANGLADGGEGHLDGSGLVLGHSPTFVEDYWRHVGVVVPPMGGTVDDEGVNWAPDWGHHGGAGRGAPAERVDVALVHSLPIVGGGQDGRAWGGGGSNGGGGEFLALGPIVEEGGRGGPLARMAALPGPLPTALGVPLAKGGGRGSC